MIMYFQIFLFLISNLKLLYFSLFKKKKKSITIKKKNNLPKKKLEHFKL